MTRPDDAAYPMIDYANGGIQLVEHGLTKREAFAMAAMQGFLGHEDAFNSPRACAKWAVEQADALIAALNDEEVAHA